MNEKNWVWLIVIGLSLIVCQRILAYISLNYLSLVTADLFVDNDISLNNLGLQIDYGLLPDIKLPSSTLDMDCAENPSRLSVRIGLLHMVNGNPDKTIQCFSVKPLKDIDETMLLLSAYYLEGNQEDTWATYSLLPALGQSNAPLAAMVFVENDAVNGLSKSHIAGEQRHILFDLLEEDPQLGEGYLDIGLKSGLFSKLDRVDFYSLYLWQNRKFHSDGSASSDYIQEIQFLAKKISQQLDCEVENIIVEQNLLPSGAFSSSTDVESWESLPWTYSAQSYNQAAFDYGLDSTDNISLDGLGLRMSGLWKTNDPDLYPASLSLRLKNQIQLAEAMNTYILMVRYRTENLQEGKLDIWIDSESTQTSSTVWRLGSTDGSWMELFRLSSVNESIDEITPLIGFRALGTAWIDSIGIFPVKLNGCDLPVAPIEFAIIEN